jgi:hypothetical protein
VNFRAHLQVWAPQRMAFFHGRLRSLRGPAIVVWPQATRPVTSLTPQKRHKLTRRENPLRLASPGINNQEMYEKSALTCKSVTREGRGRADQQHSKKAGGGSRWAFANLFS